MKIKATELKGSILIKREYDIRMDSKLGKATDMEPVNCACCDRKIFKVALMENGDLLGSECVCVLGREWFRPEGSEDVMRQGRMLNAAQQDYAKSAGLL